MARYQRCCYYSSLPHSLWLHHQLTFDFRLRGAFFMVLGGSPSESGNHSSSSSGISSSGVTFTTRCLTEAMLFVATLWLRFTAVLFNKGLELLLPWRRALFRAIFKSQFSLFSMRILSFIFMWLMAIWADWSAGLSTFESNRFAKVRLCISVKMRNMDSATCQYNVRFEETEKKWNILQIVRVRRPVSRCYFSGDICRLFRASVRIRSANHFLKKHGQRNLSFLSAKMSLKLRQEQDMNAVWKHRLNGDGDGFWSQGQWPLIVSYSEHACALPWASEVASNAVDSERIFHVHNRHCLHLRYPPDFRYVDSRVCGLWSYTLLAEWFVRMHL